MKHGRVASRLPTLGASSHCLRVRSQSCICMKSTCELSEREASPPSLPAPAPSEERGDPSSERGEAVERGDL